MTYHFSSPAEALFSRASNNRETPSDTQTRLNISTLIVGSGYGAAMAALALAENQSGNTGNIVVLERGDEYLPEDFPRSIADIPPHIGFERKQDADDNGVNIGTGNNKNKLRELWDVRVGEGAVTITGSGLGGTSLVNAGVVLRPDEQVFNKWPKAAEKEPWAKRLHKHYHKIEQLLGVTQTPDAESFSKYKALQHTVHALDKHAKVQPAPVSINFAKPTSHSVEHEPCNLCGNCVTGCHSGAKQSLNLNAWPLAVQLGVELFTGITVVRVERNLEFVQNETALNENKHDAKQWIIHVRKTSNNRDSLVLHADRVVLAAGALGSSSILYRSKSLSLSATLGKKFSVNGDTVKFSVGQSKPVNAVADAPETNVENPPGPTIIGVGRISMDTGDENSANESDTLIIEDGAIPYPMAAIWNEMLTTQIMISQYAGSRKTHWHQNNTGHDPLAISNDLTKHSQVLLTMGQDKGIGELGPNKSLPAPQNTSPADFDHIELVPNWNRKLDNYHKRVDKVFSTASPTAFENGLYLPNPAWQLIPPNVASEIQGADDIPSNVVSVHPLGGCAMGNDSDEGVVNCQGQVFYKNPDDKHRVYADLYVLDGAIVPAAIGANPLLTISALAYSLASDIDSSPLTDALAFPLLEQQYREMPERSRSPAPARSDISTHAIFRERLFWELENHQQDNNRVIEKLRALFGTDAIPANAKVLILDINFSFDKNEEGIDTSLEAWLQNPNVALDADARLRVSTHRLLHTSEDIDLPEKPIATFRGHVNLGVNSDSKHTQTAAPTNGKSISDKFKLLRSTSAIYRYMQFRWMDIVEEISDRRNKSVDNNKSSVWTSIKGYWRFAKMHSRWHYLEYQFSRIDNSSDPVSDNSTELKLAGRKLLAYRRGGDSLWDSLTNLPVVFSSNKNSLEAVFGIDLVRIVNGPAPLQITKSTNTPQAVLAIGQIGSYFLRTLIQTHFWSLAALPYKRFPYPEKIDDDRLEKPATRIALNTNDTPRFGIRVQEIESEGQLARLMHYTMELPDKEDHPLSHGQTKRPALMFTHGLAHGTRLFWAPESKENYLQYFLKQGFDVWLLDHRASANYRRKVDNKHTAEDLAIDVTWGVKTIFNLINDPECCRISPDTNSSTGHNAPAVGDPELVHVLAHCVGAAATSMAALGGRLQQENNQSRSMLASFSLHAVTPWLFGSAENRARQNLWWFIDQSGAVKELDSTMHNKPSWTDVLFDRIAHSMMTDTDRRHWGVLDKWRDPNGLGYTRGTYTRYRFFYGPEFNFNNVSKKLRNRFQYNAGKTPIQSVKQMFLSVVGKRLVNPEMENTYLTDDNLAKHWQFPTFFFHGHDNKVFDIESSRMSAFSLAQFRKNKIPDAHDRSESINTDDYTKFGVRLKTLKNYGHMDMIFGDDATRDIGPDIVDFLNASEQHIKTLNDNVLTDDDKPDYSAFASKYQHNDESIDPDDQPITSKIAERLPTAGPVLSHVGKNSVRIWLESDDYDTSRLHDVMITSSFRPVSKKVVRQPEPDGAKQKTGGRFWIYDLNDPANIESSVNVSIDYSPTALSNTRSRNVEPSTTPLQDPPIYTHSAQLANKPYETHFTAMPWFKREFGESKEQHPSQLSIALGSCLHPGSTFERDISDGIFEGIWQHAIHPFDGTGTHLTMDTTSSENNFDQTTSDQFTHRPLDLLLLLGDQIYADATAELFDSVDYYERYRKRYRTAWTGTWMRRVMSHLPTHFVVDDHEIHDNFTGDPSKAEKYRLEHAIQEAYNFQLHLPNDDSTASANATSPALWHTFDRLGTPFFCFDTRFARLPVRDGTLKTLFGERLQQWDDFQQWLCHNKNSELLVLASGSPLCPIKKSIVKHPSLAKHSDTLLAYPEFLHEFVKSISEICPDARILWLSGDPHFSSCAQLRISSQAGAINLTSITASGLYSPIPFANANSYEYLWDTAQSLELGGQHDVALEFSQQLLSDSYQQFTRLDVQRGSKIAQVVSYGANGQPQGQARKLTLKQAQ